MENFAIGNMAWNAGLVGIIGFFIKRFMDKTENRIDRNKEEAKKDNQEKHDDLKERIQANREFYHATYKDLKEDIKVISDLQKIANGRVSKLETNVHDLDISVRTQVKLCKQRNEKDSCHGHS